MNPQRQKKNVFQVQALIKYNILLENNNVDVDKIMKKRIWSDVQNKDNETLKVCIPCDESTSFQDSNE